MTASRPSGKSLAVNTSPTQGNELTAADIAAIDWNEDHSTNFREQLIGGVE